MNYQELLHSPLIPASVISLVEKAAHTNIPVFIQGEHGTEKELIAKIIHYTGDWKDYRFYQIDCKIQTEESLYEQFNRIFKENNSGTLPATIYLKEVGELEHFNQVRLLDLVEDGMIQEGPEKRVIKHLRFIASSSENLKEKISQGKFSEDLYHKLNTLTIHVPPLRERSREISKIAHYILKEYSKKINKENVTISNNVLRLFQNYWWPGNLRELEQVIIRSAIFSQGGNITEKDLLFEIENEDKSFMTFLKKAELKPDHSRSNHLPHEQNAHALSIFLIELVHRIKNPLVSIKTFTQLLRDKFDDLEFREHFYRIITEDIEKIDTLLNGLLNYIKINTPIEKKNTVHSILEDILKKNEFHLESKKIKVFKKFEKDLPETVVHDEQLRYILNSLLQYAIPSIPPNGSIGLLTKTVDSIQETEERKTFIEKDGKFIEILIVFTGYKKPTDQFESILGIPPDQKEETIELELRLVKEIIQNNKGTMTFEVNEKKPRTLISLKFPVERRKLIYYHLENT